MDYDAALTIENELIKDDNSKMMQKEYNFELKEDKYKLIIIINKEYIHFKLFKINGISFTYYNNKYNLNSIVYLLGLSLNLYNNLEKVLELINECYNNKNIKINIAKNKLYMILKYPLGYKVHEFTIELVMKEYNVNEKFGAVINEIILLKNKGNIKRNENMQIIEILNIFKLNIKEKFIENINIINSLKNKIEVNKLQTHKNNQIINIIKNEIITLKSELDEKNKLVINQKNQIENLEIKNKNLENKLIELYEDKNEENLKMEIAPEKKEEIQQLKIKIIKLNENLKILNQQLNEEKEKSKMFDELKKIYLNKQKEYEQYKASY